jgi:hypothetical protein
VVTKAGSKSTTGRRRTPGRSAAIGIADALADGIFEPGRERGHGLVRVVPGPVEPPVHRPTPILTGAASPAGSSLLVAVLVWPVAIASWKTQVRRA